MKDRNLRVQSSATIEKDTLKQLEGKTAVIAGGAEGIELATAEVFVKGGCLRLHHGTPPEWLRRLVRIARKIRPQAGGIVVC